MIPPSTPYKMLGRLTVTSASKMATPELRFMSTKKPNWPPPPWPNPPNIADYKHLTNKERKDQGFPCDFRNDDQLAAEEHKARNLMLDFNSSPVSDGGRRSQILKKLLHPKCHPNIHIEPPFYIDYGSNIILGEGSFINYNCILLDTAPITAGINCFIAPRCNLFTATHPLEPKARLEYDLCKPIVIGNNVWIGGASTVCPGITIGDSVVIAAGSVITKNIPSWCLVGGNPAKIIRYFPGAKEPVN